MTGRTLIVGAGPGGLAVAAELGRRGVPYEQIDAADTIGAGWSARYDSLRLHTVRWLSGLPGAPIPRRYGRWVSRDDFVSYLQDYARRLPEAPRLGVSGKRIEPAPGGPGWRVETSDGARAAPAVVVATGLSRSPYRPDWPGAEHFPGSIVHAADYRDPTPYVGRRVLVVGAGNSAAEIATELSEVAREVLLAVRTPPNLVRRDTLGVPSQLVGLVLGRGPEAVVNPVLTVLRRVSVPDLGPYGLPAPPGDGYSQFLRSQVVPILDHGFVEAVRSGRIAVVPPPAEFEGSDVRLVDDSVVRPDAVVLATGYRPDLEEMVGHLGVLDQSGRPRVHGPTTAPGAPGLHFVGLSAQLAGLLREIGREASAVARVLAGATS